MSKAGGDGYAGLVQSVHTVTGASLDTWANFYGVLRAPDEPDADLRARLLHRIRDRHAVPLDGTLTAMTHSQVAPGQGPKTQPGGPEPIAQPPVDWTRVLNEASRDAQAAKLAAERLDDPVQARLAMLEAETTLQSTLIAYLMQRRA